MQRWIRVIIPFIFLIAVYSRMTIEVNANSASAVNEEEKIENSFENVLDSLFENSSEIGYAEVKEIEAELSSDFNVLKDIQSEEDIRHQIEALINTYLDIKNRHTSSIDIAGLMSENTLLDEAVLTGIKGQYDYHRQMEVSSEMSIVSVKAEVNIRDVKTEENQVIVDAYEWDFLTYTRNGIEDICGYGTDHIFVFSNEAGTWRFVSDIWENKDFTSGEPSGGNQMAEENTGFELWKNTSYTYSADVAAAYADTYALSYNPAYSNYNSIGGDCANFVSQCLYAGGLPMTKDWFWYSYHNRSGSWTLAAGLRNYLIGKGTLIDGPENEHIKKGNPVFYRQAGSERWSHASICVGTDNSGVPVVDAHNNDRWHVNWKLGGRWGTYSTVQLSSVDTPDVKVDEEAVISFVKRLYKKVLNREADKDGLSYYHGKLLAREVTGADVGRGFVFSPEAVNRKLSNSDFIKMLYQAFMDRNADTSGLAYWKNMLDNGVSRKYVFKGFVESSEFTGICSSYGITRGNINLTEPRDQNASLTMFISRCYEKALGRTAEEAGLNYYAQDILAKRVTPLQAAQNFIFSPEFKNKNLSDIDYVKVLYRAFMGREFDQNGLNYHLNRMKNGISREEILSNFANSPEFKNIMNGFGL